MLHDRNPARNPVAKERTAGEPAKMRMTIGRLAAAGRTPLTTARYYERAGLLPQPERTSGGQRNYTDDHLRRLLFIRRARDFEFSIEEIRALIAAAAQAGASCPDVRLVAATHLKRLRRKIADLRKAEALLAAAIAQCSEKRPSSCPVLQLFEPEEAVPGR
jgi:MerR family mercuric resistance operon transcriptional regulator